MDEEEGACGGRAGLVIGDSLVRRACFRPHVADFEVSKWVPPGHVGKTWAGCVRTDALMRAVREWASTTEHRGLKPTEVAIWMGGNDVYPRWADPGPMRGELWECVQGLVSDIAQNIAPVVWVGPTPRPIRDAPQLWAEREEEEEPADVVDSERRSLVREERGEVRWEGTAAFECLDRPVVRWLGSLTGELVPVTHLSVGRCVLERRRGGRNSHRTTAYTLSRAALANFDRDGVHLSAAGYRNIVAKPGWPSWLKLQE